MANNARKQTSSHLPQGYLRIITAMKLLLQPKQHFLPILTLFTALYSKCSPSNSEVLFYYCMTVADYKTSTGAMRMAEVITAPLPG